MRKYLLFCILLLAFCGVQAQQEALNDSVSVQQKNSVYQNQLSIDVEFTYAASLSYAHRISNKWLIGGGLGLGRSVGFIIIKPSYIRSNVLGEFLHIEFLGRYEPNKRIQFDFGLRAASIVYAAAHSEGAGGIWGGYTSVTYGWKYIKIGHRLVITKSEKPILYFLPLMVRVTLPY